MVTLHGLRVGWWNISARARRLRRRGSRRSDKAVLLTRELRIGCVVHGSIALLLALGTLATSRRILGLALHVIVGHAPLLFVAGDLLIGRVGRYGDDVPGVEEAGEEAEHYLNIVSDGSLRDMDHGATYCKARCL